MRRALLFASLAIVLYACGSDSGVKTAPPAPGPGGRDGGPSSGEPFDPKFDAGGGGDDDDVTPGGSPVTYDQTVMKSSHNSYERSETLVDQLLYHRIRSVELDIHNGKNGGAPAGDWWVYHGPNVPGFNATSCNLLSDCLGALAAFHAAVPQHEVITVWIDLKDPFEATRQPADLDAMVTKALGRINIVTPEDLVAKCEGAANVRAAVAKPCAFPTLASLRGKFMLTVTGGSSCDTGSNVAKYGGAKPRERIAFLAADLNDSCPPAEYEKHGDVVFFNMGWDDKGNARTMRDKGLVGRVYKSGVGGGIQNEADWNAAKASGVVHIASDAVSFENDAWAKTHNTKGFPFLCDGCDGLTETGDVFGVTATSGDQWGTADSGYFALTNSTEQESWTAMIGVPSSHVEPFAKACLVARASEDPGAINVAFCRPFDDNPPRIQLRNATGGATTTGDTPPLPGLKAETGHFLRLDLKPDGNTTEIDALVSRDGKTWISAQKSILNAPLPLRGVSVSSHDSGARRAVFANLTRAPAGQTPEPMTAAKLGTKKAVGAAASGAAFDGVFPP